MVVAIPEEKKKD